MKFQNALLVLIFAFTPFIIQGKGFNAGFVQGLWYSDTPIFVDDTVRIFVALRNNTNAELTATVEFYDNNEKFGSREVSAISGHVVEAWVDWNATFGDHHISATLSDVSIDGIDEDIKNASVTSPFAEDTLFVDYDTDSDDIGNIIDEDDDGDNVSDKDEIAAGTDPLSSDTKGSETDTKNDEDASETKEKEIDVPVAKETEGSEGLEKFFDEGVFAHTFGAVTNTINNTKTSLDTYREERIASQKPSKSEGDKVSEGIDKSLEENPSGESEIVATITRSRVDDGRQGFFERVGHILSAFFSAFYTLILFLISLVLSYPAVVEVLLLLLTLFVFYKIAKRLGRRSR